MKKYEDWKVWILVILISWYNNITSGASAQE